MVVFDLVRQRFLNNKAFLSIIVQVSLLNLINLTQATLKAMLKLSLLIVIKRILITSCKIYFIIKKQINLVE